MKTITPRELFLIIFFILFILAAYAGPDNVHAEEKPPVFSTWEGFETDKCASIWLIKRFVDKNAVIKFFPKGEEIQEGIPFDSPDAELKRYQNMSTFESILKYYKLQDPKLLYIGKIIHDIEINIWERKALKETLMVQKAISEIITNSENSNEIIEKSLKYFDFLYLSLSKGKK